MNQPPRGCTSCQQRAKANASRGIVATTTFRGPSKTSTEEKSAPPVKPASNPVPPSALAPVKRRVILRRVPPKK